MQILPKAPIPTRLQPPFHRLRFRLDIRSLYDPRDYLKLLEPFLDGGPDVVYGPRFLGVPRTQKARKSHGATESQASASFVTTWLIELRASSSFRPKLLSMAARDDRRVRECHRRARAWVPAQDRLPANRNRARPRRPFSPILSCSVRRKR
jgi:hypothetical protein